MIRFLTLDYFLQRLRERLALPEKDPYKMSGVERRAERVRLAARLDALCAPDKSIPERYVISPGQLASINKILHPDQSTH